MTHRYYHDQANAGDAEIADPGAGNPLSNSECGRVPLVTLAAEARSLAAPSRADLLMFLNLVTDGGDCTVTVAGLGTLIFSAVGQLAGLRSIETAPGTYAWVLVGSVGGVTGTGTATSLGSLLVGGSLAERATIGGIYMNGTAIAVAVPSITNDTPENINSVDVDVSGSFTMQPAVGDVVTAIPLEALPTDCLLLGAYVTATDTIRVVFGSKQGGGGVTGANKNFKFLVHDLT